MTIGLMTHSELFFSVAVLSRRWLDCGQAPFDHLYPRRIGSLRCTHLRWVTNYSPTGRRVHGEIGGHGRSNDCRIDETAQPLTLTAGNKTDALLWRCFSCCRKLPRAGPCLERIPARRVRRASDLFAPVLNVGFDANCPGGPARDRQAQ